MADMADMAGTWAEPPDFTALNRYGWTWDAATSVDENYLDLAYLIARNSTCKDGHMGCVVVADVPRGQGRELPGAQMGEVELCTINSSLFGAYRSDCHAEANAVAESAARGVVLRGRSCYVTRAPCVACYKLLASAGVGRIVAPQPIDSPDCVASARALGIECVSVRDSPARSERREALGQSHEDMGRIQALREERKRLRAERSFGKKAIQKLHADNESGPSDETPLQACRRAEADSRQRVGGVEASSARLSRVSEELLII